MIFSAEVINAPIYAFNQPEIRAVEEASYVGRYDPSREALQQFTFEQSFIPVEGGKYTLFLVRPLLLKMDFNTMRFKVTDWGIEMDSMLLPDLPREIARRFLQLFSNAENECLSEKDQADWFRVLDYIDFKQFSIDRSAPRYMTGVLLHKKQDFALVEWHDGSKQKIRPSVSRSLNEVNSNERFSAFVKLGKNDDVLAIDRVSLMPDSNKPEDWESWPKKN